MSTPSSALPPATHPVPPSTRRDSAVVAVGVAFLAAAVVISTFYSRADGELDLTNLGVGVIATLVLLGVAGYALVVLDAARTRSDLVVWPAALGAVGAGLMVVVAFDSSDASIYLAGLVVVAVSAAAYAAAPGGALAVSGLAGLTLLYTKLVDDLVDLEVDGDGGGFVVAAFLVLFFTVAVTAIGWLLPRTRALTAILVGIFAVLAYLGIMISIGFAALFSGAFLPLDAGPGAPEPQLPSYTADVYVTLVLAALLVGLWVVASWVTHHPGFRVLVVAMTATVLPAATFALGVEHPTWWGLVAVLVGAGALAALLLRGTPLGGRRTTGGPAGPVAGPAYGPPAGGTPPPPPEPVG
jgi:hypothetical protein